MKLNVDDDLDKVYADLKSEEKKRHRGIINRLRDIEESAENLSATSDISASAFLPSSMLSDTHKKQQEEESPKEDIPKDAFGLEYGIMQKEDYNADDWFDDLVSFSSPKTRGKHRKSMFDGDGLIGGKKKKKKNKNSDGVKLVDYKKEFEPDMNLFRNLLQEQNKFTDSLQRQYDDMNRVKSSARGMNKTMTDLVENITQARALSMQLIEKNVQAKKLIAELTMKQKKEFGTAVEDNPDAMADFASTYLRTMLDNKRAIQDPTNADIVDMDENSLFDELEAAIVEDGSMERSDESDKFLRYENQNVKIWVRIPVDENGNEDLDNYTFEAYSEDGDVIDDYPLPAPTKLSVNHSTNIASDKYGNKYSIIWD